MNIQGIDLAALWGNVIGATIACAVNVWAGYVGWPQWRWLRFLVAAFAAFYAAAYAALAVGLVPFASWSPVLRGVSTVVWYPVWAGPAIWSTVIWRRTVRTARTQLTATNMGVLSRV